VTGPLLTAREVADFIGVSTETVLRWWRRGELRGIALSLPGGAVRFRPDRLDDWLERRAGSRPGTFTDTLRVTRPATPGGDDDGERQDPRDPLETDG